MGLTIHYTLRSNTRSDARALQLVAKMRELARDLPFDEVGEVVALTADEINAEREDDDPLRWLIIQSSKGVRCPWNPRLTRYVNPTRLIAFSLYPGPGSEEANIGLCQYPTTIEWDYVPKDDAKFEREVVNGSWTQWEFDHTKWYRYRDKHLLDADRRFVGYCDVLEIRTVKTKLSGWRWGSFCKTQYASEPACGGLPNFLRCHISVITLLERIGQLPGVEVYVNDEGKYGPSCYSDDYREAYAAGHKPTYKDHPGKYDAKALAAEVGDWNQMIAAYVGGLSDAAKAQGMTVEAPIKDFANFEQLEFRGQSDQLVPFLNAMTALAKAIQSEQP